MKYWKTFTSVVISLSMLVTILTVGSFAATKPEITFKMNSAYSGKLYDKMMREIAEKVNYLSEGRIQGQVIASGTMGGERELGEALQLNALDMAYISDAAVNILTKNLSWAWMPFMFDNYEDADRIFNKGWIREELNKRMAEKGIISIAVLENGFNHFATTAHPVKSLDDFKGQKVRVPEVPELIAFYKACGALPVAIPGSEVLTALEQGTIDAVNNVLFNYKQNGYIDEFKSITLTRHMYNSSNIAVSKGFWNSLSEQDKSIVKRAAEEACENYTNAVLAGEARIIDEYTAKGIEFIEPSPEFKADLMEIRDQLWEELSEKHDSEIMEKIWKEFGDK